ncbi:phosphotransferase family protein [Cytobacillus sp. Hm23]
MTTEIIFASKKLGHITDTQLQSMLYRFNLGKFVSSEKTANGVMGQTLLVTSTEGKFILKGNPLFSGQFTEEKFFVEKIRDRTSIAVPTPYLVDDNEDIFGWKYAIMPLLPGKHLGEVSSRVFLEDNFKIAEVIAETLTALHSWKVNAFGELNTKDFSIRPFEDTYRIWLYDRIIYWLNDAKKYSTITTEDISWVDELLNSAIEHFDRITSSAFVMGDFKPENFLLQTNDRGWSISGLFDFTNSYFGDPISDLIKMLIRYIDNGEQEIARHLLSVYLHNIEEKESYQQRIKVHMLQQNVLDWGCAKAMGMVTWKHDLSFSNWAQQYVEAVDDLIN